MINIKFKYLLYARMAKDQTESYITYIHTYIIHTHAFIESLLNITS